MSDCTPLCSFNEKKICAVCGDQALSYNFNALTCESCKAFFRRNAHKEKLKCAFKNNCPINRNTRKFCQCCRLRKCYTVGMKRELIMSEDQKGLKKQKILANKAKVLKVAGNKSNCLLFNGNKFVPLKNTIDQNEQTNQTNSTQSKLVDSSSQTEPWACKCFLEPTDSIPEASPSISMDKILCKLDANYRKLLDDLVIANGELEAPLEAEANNLASDAFQVCSGENGGSLLDVINLTAIAIRRLIKMCKRISGFKALCTQDQVSLLKNGCTQMMLLRSVLSFDPIKNSWKIPHTVNQLSRIKVEVLKEAQGNLYEAHEHFLTTFHPKASSDKYIFCILIAIELFDSTRPNLVDIETIQQQQDCYYGLLKRYLESKLGRVEAFSMYNHLLNKVEELHRLCEDHIRVYLKANPSQVEPLLIEIFDLKPH